MHTMRDNRDNDNDNRANLGKRPNFYEFFFQIRVKIFVLIGYKVIYDLGDLSQYDVSMKIV